MNRPPSQAVIEAVERAERDHRVAIYPGRSATRLRCRTCDRFVSEDHVHGEVARAAEAAALKAAAEHMHDLSRGTPLAAAITARAAAKRLNRWADELTDTDDRSK